MARTSDALRGRAGAAAELRGYEAAKFELAEILRALLAQVPRGLAAIEHGASELFARLAEDRFNLLIVGRFSRGKSSVINALLGVDRLPTGILPLTSVMTGVTYGSCEKVEITFEGGGLAHDIRLEQLAEYVTEQGNPGNRRRVRMAQVALPAELLRRGFHFVDSPGLGSAIVENTRTTQAFLPEADAVMLVSGFEAPLSEEEQRIASWAAGRRLPLFVALNKQDTVSDEVRSQVLEYVRRHLREIQPGRVPRIFSLSAREGLIAKLNDDAAALQRSGLPELETDILRFLVQERGGAFLTGLCERTGRLIDACPLEEALGPLRKRLSVLRHRFAHDPAAIPAATLEAWPRAGPRLRMTECRLCVEVREALFEFLRHYQYDLAVHAEAGENLAAQGGLCAHHLRLYASLASDRGVCVSLTPLLKCLVETLREGSREALLATRPRCALCALQEQVETRAIEARLGAGSVRADGVHVAGDVNDSAEDDDWCLPHLRKLAGHHVVPESLASRSRRQALAVERLVEDMQRYVLKFDGIRRALASQEEIEAAHRAIAFLAGHRVLIDRDGAR